MEGRGLPCEHSFPVGSTCLGEDWAATDSPAARNVRAQISLSPDLPSRTANAPTRVVSRFFIPPGQGPNTRSVPEGERENAEPKSPRTARCYHRVRGVRCIQAAARRGAKPD